MIVEHIVSHMCALQYSVQRILIHMIIKAQRNTVPTKSTLKALLLKWPVMTKLYNYYSYENVRAFTY
jgi:hypothetical protein